MDNIGALPVRMDLQAASISTIFSPAFRRSWPTRSTLSRCHRAALPAFVFLAKANDASVVPQRFERDSRSVSSFGTQDEQRGSIGKTIVVENCLLPLEPIEKSQSVKSSARPHQTPIASISSSEKPSPTRPVIAGLHRMAPEDSAQCGPSGVAFKDQHDHVRRKLLKDLLGGRTNLNIGEYTSRQADPWTTPASAHADFRPWSWLMKLKKTFGLGEELLRSRAGAYVANREAHPVPV